MKHLEEHWYYLFFKGVVGWMELNSEYIQFVDSALFFGAFLTASNT